MDRQPVRLLTCLACGFEFWQNSKPAVGALVVRAVKGAPHVLLTRRAIDPYKGMWDIPGGYLDNGEQPEEGLSREIREELGAAVLRARLVRTDIDEYPRADVAEEARFVLTLYFRCDIPDDAILVPADDVAEAGWFPLDRLPHDIAFACNQRALAALRETMASEGGSTNG
jgi:8-oxo-dGTP diphosphatase